MGWKRAAFAAATGLWLLPSMAMAQDAPADNAPADNAREENRNPEPTVTPPPPAPSPAGKFGLGDVRFGPSVAVGLPHPLTGGVDIVYADLLSLSVTGGRSGIKIEDTEIEIRNWDAAFRFYPFQGSFFIGAAYGTQGIVGKSTTDVEVTTNGTTLVVPTTIRLAVDSKYLTPQLGWFARWDFGLTMGFDIGYQMPSGVSTDLQTTFAYVSTAAEQAVRDSEDYKKNKDDVEKAAKAVGKTAIPYVTLFRIGWLF